MGGGAEKALTNLLKHVNREKYTIDLCVVERKGIYLEQIPDHIKKVSLFTSRFTRKIVIELYRQFNISWPFKYLTRKVVGSYYDVGICFCDSIYSDMLLFLGDKIGKQAVVLQNSYKNDSHKKKFIKGKHKERLKNRYSNIDSIIGVSQDVIDEFTSIFGEYENLKVINNPIDRDDIINKSHAFDPDFSSNVQNIIAVGSLLPVKGYNKLVSACALLRDSGRDFKLRILGTGPLEKRIKSQIQSLGLKDNILLLGFKSNPYPYMLHSDIFVMSSLSEGLPTVLCEAMILGTPAVVTNCSGCIGLVDHGTYGLMTKPTSESLFKGLKSMIDNPDKRKFYSQKGQQRSNLFNIEQIVVEYENFLNI